MTLIPNMYTVYWNVFGNEIEIAISVNSVGWVGFGISKDGIMLMSDVVVSWVDGTGPHATDRYIIARSPACPGVCLDTDPNINGTNDVLVFNGSQINGVTQMIWRRKLFTQDFNGDIAIQPGYNNVVFAFHPTSTVLTQHYMTTRGTTAIQFYTPAQTNLTLTVPTTPAGPTSGGTISATIVPSDYPFTAQLSSGAVLYWVFQGSVIELAISVQATGWVGFGPSKLGGMVGSDVMFGSVDDNTGVVNVDDKILLAQQLGCPGVCSDTDPNVGGTYDILAFNGNQGNGTTQIKWRRKLVTGDTIADLDIIMGQQMVVYAWNPTLDIVTKHADNTKFSASLNFATGGISILNIIPNQIAHGFLMFFCWAVFIPFGSIVARYLKKYSWWFNVHRLVNSFAMMLLVIAFILAVDFQSTHFNTIHPILGLIVVTLGLSQPVIGTVADKWFSLEREGVPIFPDRTHLILGYITLLAGITNIAIGLNDFGAPNGLFIAYIVYGAVIVTAMLLFAIFRLIVPPKDGPGHK